MTTMFVSMKPIVAIAFLLFISFSAFPNASKLFPGYFISKTGDTVKCKIEFNDWNYNPKSIRVELINGQRDFGPDDINGFGVNGYGDYTSAKVTYHINQIAGSNIPGDFSDSTITKTFFLRIDEQGSYSLYSLILPERVYYFISGPDNSFSELIYRVKEENDTLLSDETYKKQLVGLYNKEGITGIYFNRINSASYNGQQISSLIRILNENRTGVHLKKKSAGEFNLGIYTGVIQNSFPTAFDGVYSHNNKLDPSYSITGGVNFLFSIPGNFKSFRIGLAVGYNGYKYHVTKSGVATYHISDANYGTVTYIETYSMSKSLIVAHPYVMYVVNPLSKINGYVKAGFNYNLSMGSDPDMTVAFNDTTVGIRNGNVPVNLNSAGSNSLITLRESFLSFVGSVGFIAGKSRLEFSYCPPTNLAIVTGVALAPNVETFKIGSLGLYYYFSFF